MTYMDGPFVQVACCCENVLEDKSGALSLIRIIDTVTRAVQGPNPPKALEPFTHNFFLVISLKSGTAQGRYDLRVIPHQPDGSTKDGISLSVHFDGDEKGYNFVAQMAYQFEMEGLHYFEVLLEDKRITSIPLRVKYDRIVTGQRAAT